MKYDDNFEKIMEFTFKTEGGFNDSQYDLGGRTNQGVTQSTYNGWRKKKGLPPKDVLYITKEEAKQLYYEEFWVPTGAAKMEDLREAYLLFDMAINSGPYNANKWFKNSDENIYKFLKNRALYYEKLIKAKPSQEIHREGWMNRLRDLEQNMNALVNEKFYIPPYQNELTPFDNNYSGPLQKVDTKGKNELTIKNMRNKYLYLIHKTNEIPTGYATYISDIVSNLDLQNKDNCNSEIKKITSAQTENTINRCNNSIAEQIINEPENFIDIIDYNQFQSRELEEFIRKEVQKNSKMQDDKHQKTIMDQQVKNIGCMENIEDDELYRRLKRERGHVEVRDASKYTTEQLIEDTLKYGDILRQFCRSSDTGFGFKSDSVTRAISDVKQNPYYTHTKTEETPKPKHSRFLNFAHEAEIEQVVSGIFDSVIRELGYDRN